MKTSTQAENSLTSLISSEDRQLIKAGVEVAEEEKSVKRKVFGGCSITE